MKKVGRLKLNDLSKPDLEKRKMNSLVGGSCCECGCGPPNNNVSSNETANYNSGYSESGGTGGNCTCLIGVCDTYTVLS